MGAKCEAIRNHEADVAAVASAVKQAQQVGLEASSISPAEALGAPPVFNEGAVKIGSAKQFFNPDGEAKVLGNADFGDKYVDKGGTQFCWTP